MTILFRKILLSHSPNSPFIDARAQLLCSQSLEELEYFFFICDECVRREGSWQYCTLLPLAASALECHKGHCTLQCSCECSCVCPHFDVCFLLQPSITLILPGCVGLWGSMCCHLPTSSATAHVQISIQTAITACVSSWASLAVHREPC